MFKTILKKFCKFIIFSVIGLYVLFLILPIIANPFLAKYSEQISKMAEEKCGLKIKIEKLGIVTAPNLSVGIKLGNLSAATPDGVEFLSVENTSARLSLIPLIYGRIEADNFSIDDIDATLRVKPDGSLEIADYLPEEEKDETKEQMTELPMGLKLSNKMPNIYIKEYSLAMEDLGSKRTYTLQGGNLKVTDFVINKSIKVSTVGTVSLEGQEQFKYNLKIANYIMPDIDLNDLIFAQNSSPTEDINKTNKADKPVFSNIFDVFRSIKQNGLTANANFDVILSGKPDDINIKGLMDVENLSVLVNGKKLPDGYLKFQFENKKAHTDIKLFTADNETTSVLGEIIHGKNHNLNLQITSNASINNIIQLINSIGKSFNYNDLNTLSATGKIDADFKVKSDLKTLVSSGYLKVPSASIKYGLYNLFVDKINADVDLNNNNLNIKNLSFTILQQPLKLYGTISDKTYADLHLTADKLLIKGLIALAGQLNLLKENDIKSGTLSMDAHVKGYLKEISPVIKLSVNNLNVFNKPSSTSIKLNLADVDLSIKDKTYKGKVDAKSINIINPAASFNLPKIKLTLDEKDINIDDTYLMFSNSRFDIKGKVSDYSGKNIAINLLAKGAIVSGDIKPFIPKEYYNMITFKGSMPILALISGNDKTQNVDFQLLATPNGFVHMTDMQSVNGKSTLVNSKIKINGDSLSLENTGVYATNITTLGNNPTSNISGTQILKVSGGVSNFADMKLNSLNISTVGEHQFTVPSYPLSKALASLNITLNGNLMSPDMKGNISIPSVILPSIKTTFKDIKIDLGKLIEVNIPSVTVSDSSMNMKASINPNFSKGIVITHADFNASKLNADTLTAELAKMPSGSGGGGDDIGVIIQSGKGSIARFNTGKIVATNLVSDFNLKNNIFTLKNMTGNSFNGKIEGDISCNVIKGNSSVTMKGSGMKAVDAIYAFAGIQNALSGTLGFDTKLTLNAFAPDFNQMLKSVNGKLNFNVKDGNYINIGTLDQFIFAGNIGTNAMLKAALVPVKRMPVVQNSSRFSLLKGSIDLGNGIATLKPVTSAGNSIAYYVTGTYNLLNGYTNVNILGRMGADVVAALGPLGQLSASKITSYILGASTVNLLKSLTANPKTEDTSLVPALTTGSTNYKDFKVVFNGNVTSPSSVKTFKWLSECDISEIDAGTIKEQFKTGVYSINQDVKKNIDETKKNIEEKQKEMEQKKAEVQTKVEEVKTQVQKTKNTIEELRKIKDSLNNSAKPSQQTQTNTSAETSSTATTTQKSAESTSQPAKTEAAPQTQSTSSGTSAE